MKKRAAANSSASFHCMTEPIHTRLRVLRREAGLTQDDIARCLGVGGRSYVAMLESGNRIPHVRDTILLSMLFGMEEAQMFPALYSSTRTLFQSNLRQVIGAVMAEEGNTSSERIKFLRDALTSVELDGNVELEAI